jgi:hypothetical protein
MKTSYIWFCFFTFIVGLCSVQAQPRLAADVYASYFGGSGGENNMYIAVDPNGCVILVGHTTSTNLPVKNAYQSSNRRGPCDGFIAKFTPDMTDLVFSTYLGGTGYDEIKDVAVDSVGNIYITGLTRSNNYPLSENAMDASYNGGEYDAFLTILTPDGQLHYSSYLGGRGNDYGLCIAALDSTHICIAGGTSSTNFPVASATSIAYQGGEDSFITLIDLSNDSLVFSTYLGGTGLDVPNHTTLDESGNIYVCGQTESPNFPIKDGLNATHGGERDGYLVKFSSQGELIYASLIGGSASDTLRGLDVGPDGEVFFVGWSGSSGLACSDNAFKTAPTGNDVLVGKLNVAGDTLTYLSYLGGSRSDYGTKIQVMDQDIIIIAGHSQSSDFPLSSSAYDQTVQNFELFVSALDITQREVCYSSFLGGSHNDYLFDSYGWGDSFYVSGLSESTNFPVSPDAYAQNRRGSDEAVLARFTFREIEDHNGPVQNISTGKRYNRIADAVTYAQSDEEIVLEPGIHTGDIILADKNLCLRSIDPNDPYYIGGTIIQGNTHKPVLTFSNNSAACTLAGLTIRAGSIGISGTTTQATIRNCRIMDNISHGLELSEGSSPHLVQCLISANGQTGITMHPPSGRRASHCQPTIEDCVIVDNGGLALDGGEPVIVDSVVQDITTGLQARS